jgi:hypothetical protein
VSWLDFLVPSGEGLSVATLLASDGFWIFALTALAFLVSFLYVNVLYAELGIPWGNVSFAEVFIRGVPALGVVVASFVYLVTEPNFPWHNYVQKLELGSGPFMRLLVPAVAVAGICAIGIAKIKARLARSRGRRADIETHDGAWRNVVVLLLATDLIAFWDPETGKNVVLPWSTIKKLETVSGQGERKRRHRSRHR